MTQVYIPAQTISRKEGHHQMSKVFSRLERMYVTKETAYGTAVTPTATDAVRVIKLAMFNQTQLLRRRDKTGSRSQTQGVRGRTVGRWSYEGSLYGSGDPGVAPDADVLFQMLFGATGTVVADTSIAYALTDNIITTDIWSFRRPSTADQRVMVGSVLQNFQFNLGQDVAEWTCDGIGLGMLTSKGYATADTDLKGGLGSFPSEPGSQTYVDGGLIAGFTGAIEVDGVTLAAIRTATIKGTTGNALVEDAFGHYYPVDPEGDERRYQFSFNAYDDDTAGMAQLKEAAEKKTAITATLQVGLVAGNIFTFEIAGVQMEQNQLDDSGRSYVVNFGDGSVSGSDVTALDELTLTIT
jgi:hypothetical protein